MTVTSVRKDLDQLRMWVDAEFDAPPERVWQVWEDPRQLERWWGPPMYPATFTMDALRPGSPVSYYMTSPDGTRYHGWWEITQVEPPRLLAFVDGFAHEDGRRNDALPTTDTRVTLQALDGGRTRMSIESQFATREGMEQVIAMGVEEGLKGALGQIDGILAERAAAV